MATRKRKTQDIFDVVRRRSNAHGSYYNCCFKDSVQSIPTLEEMQTAIRIETGREDLELRARNDGQFDSSRRIWIDLYPKVVSPFAIKAAEQAEVTS